MDLENLALVIAPNILYSKSKENDVQDSAQSAAVLLNLLLEDNLVFVVYI